VENSWFRVQNLGPAGVKVRQTNSSGAVLTPPGTIGAGSSGEGTVPSNISKIYIENLDQTSDGKVVLWISENVNETSGVGNPLAFVLMAPSGSNRTIVGSFFAPNGEMLADFDGKTVFTMTVTTTAQAFAKIFLTRSGAPGTDNIIWARATEFQGILIGDPVALCIGDNATEYAVGIPTPSANGPLIYPGAFRLTGSGIYQDFANPPGLGSPSKWTTVGTINNAQTSTIEIDLTASAIGALVVEATGTNDSPALQIQAFRRVAAYDASSTVAMVASEDQSFPIGVGTKTALIELPMGRWQVNLKATTNLTNVKYMTERYQ